MTFLCFVSVCGVAQTHVFARGSTVFDAGGLTSLPELLLQ